MHYFGFLGSEPTQALESVEPILDDLLAAHEKVNYEQFAGHLQQSVREKMQQQQFQQAATETNKRLGRFLRREFLGGLRRDGRPMLLWAAKFSNSDNDILISLILAQEDDRTAVHWFWLE